MFKMPLSLSKSPFINVFLFSLFWSLQIIISKAAFMAGAKPVAFVLQAAVVVAVFLSALVLPKHYRQLRALSKHALLWLLLANAIHFGLGGFFSNAGMALTAAINAGFLVKFALVSTIVLESVFLKEKFTTVKLLAILPMLLGAYLISTGGQVLTPQIGDVLIVLAFLSWSTGNILVCRALKGSSLDGDVVSFFASLG